MTKLKKILIILLWFGSGISQLVASFGDLLPSYIQGRNSKIYMIEEADGACDECAATGSADGSSGKTSIETLYNLSNEEKKQQFLNALKSNNVQDLIAMLDADAIFRFDHANNAENIEIPFYVTDHKKDLIALKHDLPIEVYHNLMALGGGLTKEEYKLLQDIESQAIRENNSIEHELRKQFVAAITEKNFDRVKSLIDIDQCLRYQDYLHQEYRFKNGPLLTSLFDDGMTPLHFAVQANNVEMVDFFIKNGLSVNIKAQKKSSNSQDYRPLTPLDFAIVYRENIKNIDNTPSIEFDRSRKIIDMLLAAKADLSSTDRCIQRLIHGYVTAKIQQPTIKKRLTMYQSVANMLSTGSAKVSPE